MAYDIDTYLSQTTLGASAAQLNQELEEAMSDLPIHRVSDSSAGVETVDCHGVEWSTDQQATLLNCNGGVPFQNWSCTNPVGNVYGPLCGLPSHGISNEGILALDGAHEQRFDCKRSPAYGQGYMMVFPWIVDNGNPV